LEETRVSGHLDPVLRAYARAPVSFNSGYWSFHKGYNTNLLDQLNALKAAKRIQISTLEIHHAPGNLFVPAAVNPFNASTFIEWNSLDSAAAPATTADTDKSAPAPS